MYCYFNIILISICIGYLFPFLTFNLYMSLGPKSISCRLFIYLSWFCIHSASLYLLIGALNPFKFKVIFFWSFIYLFLALWSSLMSRLFSSCGDWGLLSSCGVQTYCSGLSYCRAQALELSGFSSCSFCTLEHRLNCCCVRVSYSMACEIFLDWGLNLCFQRWQVDSLLLSHLRSPKLSLAMYVPVAIFLFWTCFCKPFFRPFLFCSFLLLFLSREALLPIVVTLVGSAEFS